MRDERSKSAELLGRTQTAMRSGPILFLVSAAVAALVALMPEYPGLEAAARWTLFILLFAAGLWVTEAIPAFAVALLVIGLEIAILGRPGGVFATGKNDWTLFVAPWASPVIWLFFGGFVLAEAAGKTGLDRWLSGLVLSRCGNRPRNLLLGVMGITFTFSMFVSNTATTAMMMAVIAPIVARIPKEDGFGLALLLGVPFAANLGGMGTVIGSPPNAIAVGVLGPDHQLHFLKWMLVGLPPAVLLFGVTWLFLVWRYPSAQQQIELGDLVDATPRSAMPLWQRITVMVTFFATIALWMTGPLHGIPTPVVSFLPITVFTVTSVLDAKDIRRLHWDILLLLTGGLALGVAVTETGLAKWLVARLPVESLGPLAVALFLAYLCSALSNFMSNTAAANILIPIAAALGHSQQIHFVVPIALAASSAMCLPVSTPPNAIAFGSGRLRTTDFLAGGLLIGSIAPLLTVYWCRLIGN